jgi:hypothetical protein
MPTKGSVFSHPAAASRLNSTGRCAAYDALGLRRLTIVSAAERDC